MACLSILVLLIPTYTSSFFIQPRQAPTLQSHDINQVNNVFPIGMVPGDSENVMESIISSSADLDLENLIDMDVIIYCFKDRDDGTSFQKEIMYLGAVQEDGTLSPLSTWTTEPAFGTSLEFLVDEADRFALTNRMEEIRLHTMVPESQLSYGSRQCHRGVGNPHGEESEILYYVDQQVIDKYRIGVTIKPHLEILW